MLGSKASLGTGGLTIYTPISYPREPVSTLPEKTYPEVLLLEVHTDISSQPVWKHRHILDAPPQTSATSPRAGYALQ